MKIPMKGGATGYAPSMSARDFGKHVTIGRIDCCKELPQGTVAMGNGHILVVDDEAEVRELLQEYLGKQGFQVSIAENVPAARTLLDGLADGAPAAPDVDLVILDLRMPGEDGLVLARELRSRGNVGIIMLTASGETIDRVVGLEIGADDYMGKPFDPRELLARIRSVLRRTRLTAQLSVSAPVSDPEPDAAPNGKQETLSAKAVRFGRCLLDLDARRLFAPDGAEVPITAMQFDLMEAFINHPNRVLSRDRLLELAHKRGDEPFDRSIDIRIARLRRKIEEHPERPQTIKTVHGVGYIYVPAD
jgi:DNA-binding response OmpR family regulator